MQIDYYDYYYNDYDDDNNGCCLKCDDAEDGCLCYNCKCTKCYHYSKPDEYDGATGSCDIVTEAHTKSIELGKKVSKFESESCCDYTKLGLDKKQMRLTQFNV